jgi:tRNA-specific 2-thiouridylase
LKIPTLTDQQRPAEAVHLHPPLGDGKTVVVGMSGGVDSAVAAALLQESGYNVIGVTLILWKEEGEEQKRWQDRSCCKVGLARHVAKQLSIPHHTIDVQDAFQKEIIDNFCDTYLLGQTPNPCVRCNERIKFARLLSVARELGGDFLATGHYARIQKNETGYTLLTGIDPKKDQSYFLYRLNQEQLSMTLFPLGEMQKEAVYEKAAALGLPYEEILESQEVCFVNQKGYRSFLAEQRPEAIAPGAIVTESGEVIGSHQGVAFHTVGQRRGLGVALGERIYVTRIDPEKKEIVVGEESDLHQHRLVARNVVWGGSALLGRIPASTSVTARIRYRAQLKPVQMTRMEEESFELIFNESEKGLSPGQSVVLYQGDAVLGGGIIQRV